MSRAFACHSSAPVSHSGFSNLFLLSVWQSGLLFTYPEKRYSEYNKGLCELSKFLRWRWWGSIRHPWLEEWKASLWFISLENAFHVSVPVTWYKDCAAHCVLCWKTWMGGHSEIIFLIIFSSQFADPASHTPWGNRGQCGTYWLQLLGLALILVFSNRQHFYGLDSLRARAGGEKKIISSRLKRIIWSQRLNFVKSWC